MDKFVAITPVPALKPGLVLKIGGDDPPRLLRITHVFDHHVYLMLVTTPANARYARRPQARQIAGVQALLNGKVAVLGKLSLPAQFRSASQESLGEADPFEAAMEAIRPLIESFASESNLHRSRFNALITERAKTLDMDSLGLRRLVLRYYYFGGVQAALNPLRTGKPAGAAAQPRPSENSLERAPKRRGRQPVESKELGRNEFVCCEDDIDDMVQSFKKCASRGLTEYVSAHLEYIRTLFAKRHPDLYAQYLDKKCPMPVTLRQYRTYVSERQDLTKDLLKNVPALRNKPGKGGLLATGSGEMYEIDATGGRIFLVDSQDSSVCLGTPIIYLLIDRWSRYVVSFYITLRPASWEEIRFSLLIAFTPRKRRFKNLGVDVDEERWPKGVVCAKLVCDRGSEIISTSMLQAAAKDLKIELLYLPPLCPDGKGIIERLIRELKRKMSQRGIKGVYAERPIDPKTKRVAKQAKQAAALSLRQIYWELYEIVDDYNNRPHSALVKNKLLMRTGVNPTPRAAYVWGLTHITGIQSPPLTDEDYQRILLGVGKATIANGSMRYKNHRYLPANAAAERMASKSTSRRKELTIRIDRSDPVEFYVQTGDEEWPLWQADATALQELRDLTLEEEDSLADRRSLTVAMARNDATVGQLKKTPTRRRYSEKEKADVGRDATRARRQAETTKVKQELLGKTSAKPKPAPTSPPKKKETWQEIEERERLATVAQQRSKR